MTGKSNKLVGVKASTIALLQASFGFVLGLAVAILNSLEATINLTKETNSVLVGLSFGLTAGIVSIIILPLVYFGIAWVLGYINGWILNLILRMSGGVTYYTEK